MMDNLHIGTSGMKVPRESENTFSQRFSSIDLRSERIRKYPLRESKQMRDPWDIQNFFLPHHELQSHVLKSRPPLILDHVRFIIILNQNHFKIKARILESGLTLVLD